MKEAEAQAVVKQKAAVLHPCCRILDDIKGCRPLKHIKQPQPSYMSYNHARVLIDIKHRPKLDATPSTSSLRVYYIAIKILSRE